MAAHEGDSPENNADSRLGDLFSNLPDPTQQIPTGDASDPAPGSRRAAREAASGRATTPADGTPVAAPSSADPSATPVRSSADAAGTASATPVRDAADAGDTPTRAVPQQAAAPAAAAPVLGGGLDDLFAPQEDERVVSQRPKKKRRGCLVALIIVLVIFGGIAAAGAWAWSTYGERISETFGWGEPKDWDPGMANGEAVVTIKTGDTGGPVSVALFEAGVTKTEDVFYDYIVQEAPGVTFYPGVYQLQKKMTAEAALAALQDENNKMDNTVSVGEGATIVSSLPGIADSLGLPLADFEAAVADPSAYGVDAQNLEGWLFPAVYTFDPGVTPTQVIQRMVDRTRESLAGAGVPDADAERILTIASVIQREGRTADFAKVSRVIQNRLDIDMKLQMDSTAQYGYGSLHEGVVSSSAEALEDPNPWNTYVNTGLPVTPIASPSDAAIQAAMNPETGPWLYFVTVNLSTGETRFSETYEQHQEGIKEWQAWCRANPDGGC